MENFQKLFDSAASQTPIVETISVGTDTPSFSIDSIKDDIKLCSKCKQGINFPVSAQKENEKKSLEDLFNVINF